MKLPIIKNGNHYEKSIVRFGGINKTGFFTDGEMEDATGISHRLFPAITQREKSSLVFECESPSSAVIADKECVAADGALYYDRKKVAELSPGEKMLVVLGKKVIVFPDKLCYDTRTDEIGDLRGLAQTYGATVTFTGNTISVPEMYAEEEHTIVEETFPKDMEIATYKTATVKNDKITFENIALKKVTELVEGTIHVEKCNKGQYCIVQSIAYSEVTGLYTVMSEKITVKNLMENIFDGLVVGDVVEIDGCTTIEANNKSATIISKTDTSLTFDEGTFTEGKESGFVTIQRKIPDFTCVLSYENRLWGCEENVIYASALGDATNFFKYRNLSTDSYTIESNSAGDFTACAVYTNGCLFFKENVCYRLFGSRPSNFQLSQCFEGGIRREDAKSLVNMGGRLVYKGIGGVYVYSGGTPRRISDKLGDEKLENTAGGSDGRNYFLTADTQNSREEFVWDSEKDLWSKSGIKDTASYLCAGKELYRLKPQGIEIMEQEADEDAEWSITFRPFDEGHRKTKNYSRIHICAELFDGAYIKTELCKDGGVWECVNTSYGSEKKYVDIPCVTKGCHEVQLRLSGKGKSIINSVTREFRVN